MKQTILLCLGLVFCMQFGFSQTKAERKAAKKAREAKTFDDVKALIDTKAYTFEANWASAQGGQRINLMSNPNFLTVDQNTAEAYLPYFGVAQIASYGGDGGIKFEGPTADYTVSYNEKKRIVTVKFNTSHEQEGLNATLRVFSPESATLFINSTNRNSISYDGTIKPKVEKNRDTD